MLNEIFTRLRRFAEPVPVLGYRSDAIEAWSMLMGREAAQLWLEALSRRDMHSNV